MEKKVEDTKIQGKGHIERCVMWGDMATSQRHQREQGATRSQENWEEFFSREFRALLTS